MWRHVVWKGRGASQQGRAVLRRTLIRSILPRLVSAEVGTVVVGKEHCKRHFGLLQCDLIMDPPIHQTPHRFMILPSFVPLRTYSVKCRLFHWRNGVTIIFSQPNLQIFGQVSDGAVGCCGDELVPQFAHISILRVRNKYQLNLAVVDSVDSAAPCCTSSIRVPPLQLSMGGWVRFPSFDLSCGRFIVFGSASFTVVSS